MSAVFTCSGGSVTLADTGSFQEVCKFRDGETMEAERVGGTENAIESLRTAGVDGAGTKDYGYTGRQITLSAIYVNSSAANVASAWAADEALLRAAPSSLAVDGVTYYGCVFDGAKSGRTIIKKCGASYYYTQVTIAVTAKRLA